MCLPELFRSQYFCQTEDVATFDLAEPIPGPTTDSFTRLAAELNEEQSYVVSATLRASPNRKTSSSSLRSSSGARPDFITIPRW